jgi:hypothetical protein
MVFVSLMLLFVTLSNTSYSQSTPPTGPYVYVLVWRYYDSNDPLSSAISTYKDDLENAGFSVEIKFRPDLGNTPEAIRELLQTVAETHEMVGALLVGDIPHASYEMEYAGSIRVFPCDLYYMDLDGNWTDSDGNGVYDMHTDETGDLEPEIWVGRLYASTVTWGNEDELLINYFDKNHRFRTGNLTLPRRALAYIDNEFVYSAGNVNNSLSMIYGSNVTLVTDPNITNATDYKNRLNDTLGYEWLHLVAHGNYEMHAFDTGDAQTNVFSSDIRNIDPHVLFYNIMACNIAHYTLTDYIGSSYLFADTYGLLVVGSTKLHYIWDVRDFYKPIAEGKCIGQALKEWLEKNGELDRFTAYGLIILGDPTLRTPRTYNQTRDIAVISVMTSTYEVYSGWNVTINVTLRNEGIFVETFNVTVYYDGNVMGNQTVNLFPKADITIIFIWDTIGVHGNYTISAHATPVPNETDIADNTFEDGKIYVKKIYGDINGDGRITLADVGKMDLIYSGIITDPELVARADINDDGFVTLADVGKLDLIYSGIL